MRLNKILEKQFADKMSKMYKDSREFYIHQYALDIIKSVVVEQGLSVCCDQIDIIGNPILNNITIQYRCNVRNCRLTSGEIVLIQRYSDSSLYFAGSINSDKHEIKNNRLCIDDIIRYYFDKIHELEYNIVLMMSCKKINDIDKNRTIHEMQTNIVRFGKNIDYTITLSLMVMDIIKLMKYINMNDGIKIVNIYNYSGNESDFEQVKKIVEQYKDNAIICTTACASAMEFPNDKYYLNEKENGKKCIPIEDILIRETERLESCGFVDFNFFSQYENQRAMIYPNELGNKVLEAAQIFINEK